jgi:hypothetical protein
MWAPLQCDLEANEGVLTAMVAATGGVQYCMHTGARGAPRVVSPAETDGGDFGAWLDGRCALVRCAMPMQLRLYGIKVSREGNLTQRQPFSVQSIPDSTVTPNLSLP